MSDFCTAYVNVRFNASQTGETVVADIRRTLDALAAADPRFAYEIEFPPRARARARPARQGRGGRAEDGSRWCRWSAAISIA